MLRAWMLDSMPPSTFYHQRYGRWVSEPAWPSPHIEALTYKLAQHRLVDEDAEVADSVLSLQSPLSNGLFAGKWCSYSATPDLPHDQREEDGGALLFTTAPLKKPLEILGAPLIELELAANRPVAMLAVRLSDMRPDNKVTRVTYGLLNLTHRDDHANPLPLVPGKRYCVRIQLNDVAQTFPKGHRIRIALSSSYFPLAWPPPESTHLKIHTGISRLILPARQPREEAVSFQPPQAAASAMPLQVEPVHHNWRVIRELDKDFTTLEVINDAGVYRLEEIDLTIKRKVEEWYTYQGDDFQSPRGKTRWQRRFERGDWSVETITRTVLHCDESYFYLDAELDAYEGDKRVYSQNWNKRIKRNLV
jgi:hypothetical protein